MHLKRVYEFISKKGNPRGLSTREGGPHQNHLVMNARILSDAQFILQQNE